MESGHPAVDSCLAEGKVWKEQAQNLILISLYETRFRRAVEKDMAELDALQEKRKEATPAPKTKPSVSCNWRYRKGKTTTPATISCPPRAHGEFVFSAPELLRVIDRAARLSRSWDVNKRPPTFPKKAA